MTRGVLGGNSSGEKRNPKGSQKKFHKFLLAVTWVAFSRYHECQSVYFPSVSPRSSADTVISPKTLPAF